MTFAETRIEELKNLNAEKTRLEIELKRIDEQADKLKRLKTKDHRIPVLQKQLGLLKATFNVSLLDALKWIDIWEQVHTRKEFEALMAKELELSLEQQYSKALTEIEEFLKNTDVVLED
jgi:hypothetical protein